MDEVLTEAEQERMMTLETRAVEMPCGTSQLVTVMKFVWSMHDHILILDKQISQKEICAYAAEECDLQQIAFADGFTCVVDHIFHVMVADMELFELDDPI